MQRIPNSNHSDRLKISASQMLVGNMLNLDAGIFDKFPSRSGSDEPLSKYMSNLLSIQENLLKASREELPRTDLLPLTTKEQNKHTEYTIDSYVLVHYRTGLPPTRLHTTWKSLLKLIKGLNSCDTLLDLITGKEMDFHLSDMKPFVFDSAVVDPMDVARCDYMEYFADKILQHRGNLRKSTSMEFEVNWLNYPPDSNTWT